MNVLMYDVVLDACASIPISVCMYQWMMFRWMYVVMRCMYVIMNDVSMDGCSNQMYVRTNVCMYDN